APFNAPARCHAFEVPLESIVNLQSRHGASPPDVGSPPSKAPLELSLQRGRALGRASCRDTDQPPRVAAKRTGPVCSGQPPDRQRTSRGTTLPLRALQIAAPFNAPARCHAFEVPLESIVNLQSRHGASLPDVGSPPSKAPLELSLQRGR